MVVMIYMGVPNIQGIGTAVPKYALQQGEIKNFIAVLFQDHVDHLDRLLPVFENCCIETRHLSRPLDWYKTTHSFAEANTIFEEVALDLAEEAALQAMEMGKVEVEDVGMIIFLSSTGITTPTLDAKLMQRLGLSPHTKRLPIWGLGCGGGVAGLARAAELAPSLSGKSVLLVTVELCSLTFQQNDYSKSNLVGTSLFADGAAAVLLNTKGDGPEIHGSYSTLFSNSAHVMGWDLVDTGFKVRFSRDIPSIVRQYLPQILRNACLTWGILEEKICHYIMHPGGAKVLSAYRDSLGLCEEDLTHAYEILRCYGNMSSASVLFVLAKYLKDTTPKGAYGLMLALGPGFSAEQVLIKW